MTDPDRIAKLVSLPPPRGVALAADAMRRMVPRDRVALAVEGVVEQMRNVRDLLGSGRAGEARLALADVTEELRELLMVLKSDRRLAAVADVMPKDRPACPRDGAPA